MFPIVTNGIHQKQNIDEEYAVQMNKIGYRALFNNDHVIMLLIDPGSLSIIEANQAACIFYGLRAEEFTGKKIFHICLLSEEEMKEEMEKAKNGIQNKFFSRHLLANNEIRYAEVNVIPIINGDQILLCSIVHDLTGTKEAGKELQNNDEQYRSLFTEIPIATMIHDKDSGEIIDANPAAYTSFGFSSLEELQANDIWFEPPYSIKDAQALIRKAAYEGTQEFEWLHKINGRFLWLYVRLSPVVINGVQRVMSASIDITEKKRVEDRFAEETTRRRILVEQSNDGIVVINDKGEVVEANQKYADTLGYSMEEVLQLHVWDWDNKWTPEELIEEIKNTDESGRTFETYHRRKDGTLLDVEVSSNGAILAGQKLVFCVCRDITERKRTEEKISEEATRRRILVDQSNDGIVVVNDKGEVVEANQKYADMLGYSMEEVLKLHVWDWEYKSPREEILELIELTDESGLAFETCHLRKDGTLLDVEVSSNGAILGGRKLVFCVCRDITERKRAEDALIHAKMDAEAANMTKSEFLANMSHELRTPLNSILGFSQMLNEQIPGELNEKQISYVSNIMKSSKHLVELINDILDLSKIEAGKMELECEIFPIVDLIDETVTLMQPLASKKHISTVKDIRTENMEIYADRKKIKDIMHNLLSNAVKFTPDRGKICIKASHSNERLHISISDTGIGISKDDQLKIFEPFKQVNSFLTREVEGTGLGLAIVKKYVKMHGGVLKVESDIGKGSTFTFIVPIDLRNE